MITATPSNAVAFNMTSLVGINPYTPMALLPPNVAREAQNTVYVQIGTLGMFLWDILTNLRGDYQIIMGPSATGRSSKIGLPTIVYFLSRMTTLASQLSSTLLMTAPVNCSITNQILRFTSYFSMISTALLFFFRVSALYHHHHYLRAVFFSLWIVTIGLSSVEFLFIDATTLPILLPDSQQQCIIVKIKRLFALIPALALLLHDTVVFLAISYKLYRNSHLEAQPMLPSATTVTVSSLGNKTGAFFFPGKNLPAFSRSLLKDGQVYYLISFFCSTALVILLLVPDVGDYYRLFLIPPHIAVINSMACHVFRNVKLGQIQNSSDLSMVSIKFQTATEPCQTEIATPRGGTHRQSVLPGQPASEPGSETKIETYTLDSESELNSFAEGGWPVAI